MKKYDCVIVGSGPAGLSAAVYGVRAGLDLLVIEKYPMSGGQILNTYEVDNYLGLPGINGFDLGMRFREHGDRLGVNFLNAEVTGIEPLAVGEATGEAGSAGEQEVPGASEESCELMAAGSQETDGAGRPWTVHTDQGDFEAQTVILATGADHARLGVPGEEELTGRGVSYCATCDGAFYKGKVTAVIGGGDVALEDAIYLARFCEKVYCIHRRDEFRGAKILQERLLALENVEVLYSHVALAVEGREQVEGLVLKDVKTGETGRLAVDGVFVAVGIRPNTEVFRNLVDCDGAGYILAGEDCRASRRGIYAAGDIRRKPLRQIVTAVADGANAATAASDYLNKYINK